MPEPIDLDDYAEDLADEWARGTLDQPALGATPLDRDLARHVAYGVADLLLTDDGEADG